MAEQTNIAWADSTFNPVIGCMKVSAGCDHCFAENLMDTRYGRVEWGQRKTATTTPSVGTRVRTAPSNWRKPVSWNKHHETFQDEHGHRQRVFCASLSDVFDNQWNPQWRYDLWKLIWETPHLDWLLLTKRPENIEDMLPVSWPDYKNEWPNVWLGITCEDQAAYDKRWPILSRIPAIVRFISYEPAIGALKIGDHDIKPDWLICGGETGQGHRYMPNHYAYWIKYECEQHRVPFFMKQMCGSREIPDDLMLRQFPVSR